MSISHTLIIRFLAREIGIAGRDSLEMAQVDEIVDVIQDAINANVSDGDQIRMIVDDSVISTRRGTHPTDERSSPRSQSRHSQPPW